MNVYNLFFFLLLINAAMGMKKAAEPSHLGRIPSELQRMIHGHLILPRERKYIQDTLRSNMPQEQIDSIVHASMGRHIKEIRQFLSTERKYYISVPINKFFIEELSRVYQQDPILVALRLGTPGTLLWLRSYLIGDLRYKNRVLKDPRNMNRAKNLFLHAITEGDMYTVMGLSKVGVLVHATDRDGNTPLIIAVQNPIPERARNQKRIVEWLIDHGGNINAANVHGSTPLLEAARYNNSEIFKLLLERGANPNVQGGLDKSTPLHWAISYANIPEIQLLIKHKLNKKMINAHDQMGTTPLQVAKNKKLKVVEELLKK